MASNSLRLWHVVCLNCLASPLDIKYNIKDNQLASIPFLAIRLTNQVVQLQGVSSNVMKKQYLLLSDSRFHCPKRKLQVG